MKKPRGVGSVRGGGRRGLFSGGILILAYVAQVVNPRPFGRFFLRCVMLARCVHCGTLLEFDHWDVQFDCPECGLPFLDDEIEDDGDVDPQKRLQLCKIAR